MLNLGGLFFTLDADTRGLQNAQRNIEQFAQRVQNAFAGIGKGGIDPSFANSLNRQETAMVRFTQRINQLQNTLANTKLTPAGAREAQVTMERLGLAFENFTRMMSSGALNSNQFSRQMSQMNQAMGQAGANITALAKTAGKGVDASPWRSFGNVIQGLGASALVVQGHFGGMSTRLFAFTALVREFGVTIALASAGLSGFAAGIGVLLDHAVKAGMVMQTLQQQFNATTGSVAIANHEIAFVRQVADQAGLGFKDLGDSYARFMAAATQGGLTLQQTEKVFKDISLAAGTMHLSNMRVAQSFLALQEMLSKGQVYTKELRRQLGNDLPGAFGIAANAMGVTEQKLEEMLKKGLIPATEFVPKFAEALVNAWHIDPSKNIETFRASLQRLGNQWTYLGVTIAQQTNLLGGLKIIVDAVTGAMKAFTANLTTIIGVVGAVVGAFAGLAAAWLAIQALSIAQTVIVAVTQFMLLAREIGLAATAMRGFAAATALLQGAAGLLRFFGLVAAALIGAKLGFDAFKNAVTETAQQMGSSLGSTEDYIRAQEAVGTQVRSVTNDLIKQTAAIVANASAQATALANQATQLAHSGSDITDFLTVSKNLITGGPVGPGHQMADVHKQRAKDALDQAKQYLAVAKQAQQDLANLAKVSLLPEQKGTPSEPIEKAQKGLDGIINKVKDLQQAAATAQQQFESLFAPLASGASMRERVKEIGDYGKALEIINNLKPAQLAAAARTLGVADNYNTIAQALTNLIRQQREATEATNEFLNMWKKLDQAELKLKGFSRELSYIQSRGVAVADPIQMKFFDNLAKAEEELYNLTQLGTYGQRAMSALRDKLEAAGYATGDLTKDYALFLTQIDLTQEKIKVLDKLNSKLRDIQDEFGRTNAMVNAYKGNQGIFGGIFGADAAEEFQKVIDRGKQAVDLVRELYAAGVPKDQISAEVENFVNALKQLDDEKDVLDDVKKKAEAVRESFKTMISDGLNGIKDFLEGTKNLKTALLDMAKSFIDIGWKQYIIDPLQNMFRDKGYGKGSDAAGGIGQQMANAALSVLGLSNASKTAAGSMNTNLLNSIGSVVGKQVTQEVATQSTTSSMIQLSLSARAAATALASVAAAGGGSSGGGGAGGLLGTLFSIGASIFGGGDFSSIGDPSGGLGAFGGSSDYNIFSMEMAHGVSGPMSAGQLYRINEPGIMGEYFIPRVNGYMSPNAPGNIGGSGGPYIDARTTINAPGADEAAFSKMRAYLAERDEQLRKELPYIIDSRVIDSSHRGRYS